MIRFLRHHHLPPLTAGCWILTVWASLSSIQFYRPALSVPLVVPGVCVARGPWLRAAARAMFDHRKPREHQSAASRHAATRRRVWDSKGNRSANRRRAPPPSNIGGTLSDSLIAAGSYHHHPSCRGDMNHGEGVTWSRLPEPILIHRWRTDVPTVVYVYGWLTQGWHSANWGLSTQCSFKKHLSLVTVEK